MINIQHQPKALMKLMLQLKGGLGHLHIPMVRKLLMNYMSL